MVSYVIGLTGNIATGKSTVLGMLAALGAHVIDADVLAHEVMAPGTSAWNEVLDAFGRGIAKPNAEIDRTKLGAIVFADPQALRRLEEIVHPEVGRRVMDAIRSSPRDVVVVEAIRLFEAGLDAECDEVWVVTAPPEQQLRRLRAERGLTEQAARLRMEAQPPQASKMARADVIIDNGGALSSTKRQVERQWRRILDRLEVDRVSSDETPTNPGSC